MNFCFSFSTRNTCCMSTWAECITPPTPHHISLCNTDHPHDYHHFYDTCHNITLKIEHWKLYLTNWTHSQTLFQLLMQRLTFYLFFPQVYLIVIFPCVCWTFFFHYSSFLAQLQFNRWRTNRHFSCMTRHFRAQLRLIWTSSIIERLCCISTIVTVVSDWNSLSVLPYLLCS